MKAILSVYDKAGVVELAQGLHRMGVELVSTGGTHRAIAEAGLPVQQVSDLTGFPELLDGRVKTLHPHVHAGLLARRDDPRHLAQLANHGISPLDLVVVNLYPFVATVSRPGVSLEEALENIDIGGPTLLRAAAKNFPSVLVLVDPGDYGWVVEGLAAGDLTLERRRALARKAFQHVATYDAAIARYLSGGDADLPQELPLGLHKLSDLRYGENPHQRGAFYGAALEGGGLASARQLHGKELSFNNILDADAAWRAASDFTDPVVVVVKHANPCGLALHQDQAEAYRRAYAGDPVSAFGGIVGFNRPVTRQAAEGMGSVFYEVVVAPGYEPGALGVLRKKRNLRLLEIPPGGVALPALDYRRVSGGMLVQTADDLEEDAATWKVVTQREPTPGEVADLAFAWRVVKHVKSNAIVLARDRALWGVGAGQPNRVTSVRLAVQAAGERARGCAMASDAFFPFPDGLEAAAEGGVTAVAQPGGSIRDEEVIAAADRWKVAMVFTGVRHFRH